MSDNRDDRNEIGENNAANGCQGAAKDNQGGGKGNGRLKLVKGERSDLEALAAIRDSESQPIAPYYEVIWHNATLSAGVWYHGVSTDKDGVEHFKKPQKLADPFEIVGRGQDFEGNEYRVIEFKRNEARQYVDGAAGRLYPMGRQRRSVAGSEARRLV